MERPAMSFEFKEGIGRQKAFSWWAVEGQSINSLPVSIHLLSQFDLLPINKYCRTSIMGSAVVGTLQFWCEEKGNF